MDCSDMDVPRPAEGHTHQNYNTQILNQCTLPDKDVEQHMSTDDTTSPIKNKESSFKSAGRTSRSKTSGSVAASAGISCTESISDTQLVENVNTSYVSNYQSNPVIKREPLDLESFGDHGGVAEQSNTDTKTFPRTDFGLWDLERLCHDEKNVSLKTDWSVEDFSVPQHGEALEGGNISESMEDSPSCVFMCNLCGKTFSTKGHLGVHLQQHQSVAKNCDQCDKTFKTDIGLKNHVDNTHAMSPCEICGEILTKRQLIHHRVGHAHKKLYRCNVFGKTCSGVKRLQRHMYFHKKDTQQESKFSCEICGKRFLRSSGLQMHMAVHKQLNKCDTCGHCFSTKTILRAHMKIHLGTKCDICDRTFKTEGVLQRHIRVWHRMESCNICGLQFEGHLFGYHKLAHDHESKSCDFICSICGEVYKTVDSFHAHLEIHKDEGQPYTCGVCGASFFTIGRMGVHMRLHKDRAGTRLNSDTSDKNGSSSKNIHTSKSLGDSCVQNTMPVFMCDICGKPYSSKWSLGQHLQRHSNVDKNCDQCDRTFRTDIALKNHVDSVHTTSPCEICGKMLTKGKMKYHRAGHAHKKLQRCNVCGKNCSGAIGLRRHMYFHLGKKISCEICGKRFLRSSGLRLHMAFHKQLNKCDTCGCCFSTKTILRAHMEIHLRTSVSKCEVCDKTFKTEGLLQRHIHIWHSMESCGICGLQFKRRMLAYHKLAHDHESKSRDFICSMCEEVYKTVDSFRTHLEIHKDEDRPNMCGVCGASFITITDMIGHIMRLHRDRTGTRLDSDISDKNGSSNKNLNISESLEDSRVQKNMPVFTCDICGKPCSTKWYLGLHLQGHSNVDKNCDQCDRTFRTDIALKNHVDSAHTTSPCEICGKMLTKGKMKYHRAGHVQKKLYRCNVCGKTFPGVIGLKQHRNFHKSKKISCEICGKRFLRSSGLRMHMAFHKQLNKCDTCGCCFSTKAILRAHMEIHLRTSVSKCEVCDKTFKTEGLLQRHIHIWHSMESCGICGLQFKRRMLAYHKLAHDHESKSRDFICSMCEEVYKTVDSFRTHLEIHKDEDRPNMCGVCGASFITITDMIGHIMRLHRDRTGTRLDSDISDKNGSSNKNLNISESLEDSRVQKNMPVFTCDICGKPCSTKWYLGLHLQGHSNVDKNCDQCDRTFRTDVALKNHVENAHTTSPCEICGKILTKGKMKYHRAGHVQKKLYRCNVCGKTFPGVIGLKQHRNFHKGKKISCEICGKRFLRSSGLRMHMAFHKQLNKCDTCGCCFSTKAILRAHMEIHLRTSVSKCEICDKTFKTEGLLQRHIHIWHSMESCGICGLQFKRRMLAYHKLAHDHESKSHDFICSICKEVYKTVDSFHTHLEIHKDEDRPNTCGVCGASFITITDMKSHMRLHRDRAGTRLDSDTSDINGSSNKNLNTSESLQDSRVQKNMPVFMCDICGKPYSSKWSLGQHLQRHRSVAKNCDQCDETFKTDIALKNHVDNAHTMKLCEICGESVTKGEMEHHRAGHVHKLYRCDVCGKKCFGVNRLRQHMYVHKRTAQKDKKYSCEVCGKKNSSTSSLTRHVAFHKKLLKCDICCRFFSTKGQLQTHMKIHLRVSCDRTFKTEEACRKHIRIWHRMESCDICGLQFEEQLLGYHKLAHDHESMSRDFICSICEDIYTTVDSFRTHLEVHKEDNEDQTYMCEVCGKAFVTITHIGNHMRLHKDHTETHGDSMSTDKSGNGSKNLRTSESKILIKGELKQHRTFKCDICDKGFERSKQMVYHRRMCHENTCNICGKHFQGKTGLSSHMLIRHPTKSGIKTLETIYKCKMCGRQLRSKLHLRTHYMTHTVKSSKSVVRCGGCALTFSSKVKQEAHFNALHVKESCNICEREYTSVLSKGHAKLHELRQKGEISRETEDEVKIPKGKRGHNREPMAAFLKPREVNMDAIRLKQGQIMKLSATERETLQDDRNFVNWVVRKCVDELGITSVKREHFTRLMSKMKEWLLNEDIDNPEVVQAMKKTVATHIAYHNKAHRSGHQSKHGHSHESMVPREVNMDAIRLKKCQILKLSATERETLQDDRQFLNCVIKKCVDELGITSLKGEHYARLISKMKEWVLNEDIENTEVAPVIKRIATKNIPVDKSQSKPEVKLEDSCELMVPHLKPREVDVNSIRLKLGEIMKLGATERETLQDDRKFVQSVIRKCVDELCITSVKPGHYTRLMSKMKQWVLNEDIDNAEVTQAMKEMVQRYIAYRKRAQCGNDGSMVSYGTGYLKPREVNMDCILLKQWELLNLSETERETLQDDRNFVTCVIRKCVDELGITSVKGEHYTRLMSKMKVWLLNEDIDNEHVVRAMKLQVTGHISYCRIRSLSK